MALTLEMLQTEFANNSKVDSFLSHKINPDALTKDELLFELEVLGQVKSEAQTQSIVCVRCSDKKLLILLTVET